MTANTQRARELLRGYVDDFRAAASLGRALTHVEIDELESTIEAALAQSAQQDDDGMLPDALVPVSREWYELCERANYLDRIKISGELASAIVKAVCAKPAAQQAVAVPDEPLKVFDSGPWRWLGTGEEFSGEDLDGAAFAAYRDHFAAAPPAHSGGWRSIAEARMLTLDATGISGPCAVLLTIDTGRPGPFIRQGHYDAAARAFVCHATGCVLHDAVAFIRPGWPAPVKQEGVDRG